jgi:hypothetical protein
MIYNYEKRIYEKISQKSIYLYIEYYTCDKGRRKNGNVNKI